MVFLFIVFTIVFNKYFGKSVKTFIDIGENVCMSILKCHWMVIVVNLVKQTWICNDAASWWGFVYAGSVSGIPASNGDNCRYASWHASYSALQAFYRAFCPFIQQSLTGLTKILGRVVHTGDCTAQICSMGLQSGDLAGCSILLMLPWWRKSRTTRAWWGLVLSCW